MSRDVSRDSRVTSHVGGVGWLYCEPMLGVLCSRQALIGVYPVNNKRSLSVQRINYQLYKITSKNNM